MPDIVLQNGPISEVPYIVAEYTSDTICQLYFEPAQINPTLELYEEYAEEIHLRTMGAVTIDGTNLRRGWLTIRFNPARLPKIVNPGTRRGIVLEVAKTLKNANEPTNLPVNTIL